MQQLTVLARIGESMETQVKLQTWLKQMFGTQLALNNRHLRLQSRLPACFLGLTILYLESRSQQINQDEKRKTVIKRRRHSVMPEMDETIV